MKHCATPNFWRCYRRLPDEIQQLADRCYEVLRQNPRHPSLQFKKIGRLWSVRVGLHYRALAVEDGSCVVLDRSACGIRPLGGNSEVKLATSLAGAFPV